MGRNDRAQDPLATLLEAAFALEESTKVRVSLELDDDVVQSGASARWQRLETGEEIDQAAGGQAMNLRMARSLLSGGGTGKLGELVQATLVLLAHLRRAIDSGETQNAQELTKVAERGLQALLRVLTSWMLAGQWAFVRHGKEGAEDVASEAVTKIWHTYLEGEKPPLPEDVENHHPAELVSWVSTVLRNLAIDKHNKHFRISLHVPKLMDAPALQRGADRRWSEADLSATYVPLEPETTDRSTDSIAALLDAAFAFEESARELVSLGVDESVIRDAAEARWQMLMSGVWSGVTAGDGAGLHVAIELPSSLFASDRKVREFSSTTISMGVSETFIRTAANARWESIFGSTSDPVNDFSREEGMADSVLDLVRSALMEKRLLSAEVDLNFDEEALAKVAEDRWTVLGLLGLELTTAEPDGVDLGRILGELGSVEEFLRRPLAMSLPELMQLNRHEAAPSHSQLSDRELEVLRRLVAGQLLIEIAEALHLSVKTVSTLKSRIQDKLQLPNTAALIRYGFDCGMAEHALERVADKRWSEAGLLASYMPLELETTERSTDSMVTLLDAALAFEESTRGLISLGVEESVALDAAEARWQMLMSEVSASVNAGEGVGLHAADEFLNSLFASVRKFRKFCSTAISMGASETFVETAAGTRWVLTFGADGSSWNALSFEDARADSLHCLMADALLEDRLLKKEADLAVDDAVVVEAVNARWRAIESQDSEPMTTDLDEIKLDKALGGQRAVQNFLRTRIQLPSNTREVQAHSTIRWGVAGLPSQPSHEELTEEVVALRDPFGQSRSFDRYFGEKRLSRSRHELEQGIAGEFGLSREKMNIDVIYVLLSADWSPSEIHSPGARQSSFSSIKDHPFREILKEIFGWLVEDSVRYPGQFELEFAIVGTNPEQDSTLRSSRLRLRQKRDRADMLLVYLPKYLKSPGPEVDIEVAVATGRKNVFVMSEAEDLSYLGLPTGTVTWVERGVMSDGLMTLLNRARHIVRSEAFTIPKTLVRMREGNPGDRFCAWVVLVYLYLRDLGCRRGMIDLEMIQREMGFAVSSAQLAGLGDPVLSASVTAARGSGLPRSLQRKGRIGGGLPLSQILGDLRY